MGHLNHFIFRRRLLIYFHWAASSTTYSPEGNIRLVVVHFCARKTIENAQTLSPTEIQKPIFHTCIPILLKMLDVDPSMRPSIAKVDMHYSSIKMDKLLQQKLPPLTEV